MNPDNIILATDSYKLGHYQQYPEGTQAVYSYFESRAGAMFDRTLFFGLQSLLKTYLVGKRVTMTDVHEAAWLAKWHFGNDEIFNRIGWEHIVRDHGGRLPLRIKAVAEGTIVPVSNVLMTVENTCPHCYWLTNAVESLLTHVWGPSTVATLSLEAKKMIARYIELTGGDLAALLFMLHDFGYRGASSHESAARLGLGHLISFRGTDTLPAMVLGINDYAANIENLAFSVPATEHSVMTSLGPEGEMKLVKQHLERYKAGILSEVGDSYDIFNFTDEIGTTFKGQIMERDGKFVVRPDSGDPVSTVVKLSQKLWAHFGGTETSTGHKRFDPHVGLLWGDGLKGIPAIEEILMATTAAGFAADNYVFGMGGGLLQEVSRDDQRFAFKSSSQKREDKWHDVFKAPLDHSKASKRGRLQLEMTKGKFYTTTYAGQNGNPDNGANLLKTVFEDGEMVKEYTFDEVRENADQAV